MYSALEVRISILIILALMALSGYAKDVSTLDINAPAPELALPGIDGKTYHLADFSAAKVLVVVFTCNHCPTAQAYEDRIMQLYSDYRNKGVSLIAISPNDPLAVRLDELGYSDIGDSFEDMKRPLWSALAKYNCAHGLYLSPDKVSINQEEKRGRLVTYRNVWNWLRNSYLPGIDTEFMTQEQEDKPERLPTHLL